DVLPFIEYAVRGFVSQLREQISVIREQQLKVTWINHVHERFKADKSSVSRRLRILALAISDAKRPVTKTAIPRLTHDLAAETAQKTPKTISRDLNALLDMKLIRRDRAGYVPDKSEILAFLPARRRATMPVEWDDLDDLLDIEEDVIEENEPKQTVL